ncbi:MAG: diguanylate cyclase, partial [bacterium]
MNNKIEETIERSSCGYEYHKKFQEISKYFLENIGTEIDYEKITKFILELTGAKYAAFNQFEDNGRDFQTKALVGISKHIKKGIDILGFNVLNRKWSYDKEREEKIKNNTITYFDNLRDLTEDVIPKRIIKAIEDKFNIGTTLVAKIIKDNRTLGDFTLIFEKTEKLKNKELLEIYLNQVGLFIERKKMEKNLIKARKEYYELAQKSPIGIMSCDKEGNVKFVNTKMFEILNLKDLKEINNINLLEYNFLKKQGFSVKLKQVLKTGKSKTFEMGYTSKWNKNAWLKVNINPNEEKNEVIGARITIDDITDRKIDEEILKKRVEIDPLTGAYNRNVLKDSLIEEKLKISLKNNLISCIAIIDIDDFKEINDSYGHRIGDYILKYLTVRVKNELRREDLLVRTGGDEFLIYLHNIKSEKNASYFIKRIFNKCSSSYRIEDNIIGQEFSLNISCSIGASFYPRDGENIEELMAMADTALYNVKETGKSRFFYYDPKRKNNKVERYKKRQEINEAIEKGQIIPFYQP